MALPTLTELPDTITAGTTVKYTRSPSDFPASSGWTLTLYVAGVSLCTSVGVANGAKFDFTLTSTQTTALKSGVYQWQEIATKSGERYVYASGSVEVLPDITVAVAGELQSHNERTLKIITLAIEGRLTADMQSYVIDRRQVTKIPMKELIQLRDVYEARVKAEQTGTVFVPIKMTFTGTQSET